MSQDFPTSDHRKAKLQFSRRMHGSWEDVADLVGVPVHVKASWDKGQEPRRLWEWLEQRHQLGQLREALIDADRNDLVELIATMPTEHGVAASRPADTRRHHGRMLILICALAAVAGLSTTVAIVYASGSTPTYVWLHPASPPPTNQWSDELGCARRTQWVHKFPPRYVGDVYVQVAADPRQTVPSMVTLVWGGLTWSNSIDIRPGDVSRYLGGTLLLFQKRDVDHSPSTEVVFTSEVPVCAAFGTALEPERTAPSVVMQTPHWTSASR